MAPRRIPVPSSASEAAATGVPTREIIAYARRLLLRQYHAHAQDIDDRIGLDRLRCLHVNDSKAALGSNLDRHETTGAGLLGLSPAFTARRLRRMCRH